MLNKNIISEFERLVDQIKVEIDISPSASVHTTNHFRLKQIMNALDVIKKYPKEIKSGEDLKDIKGIGKGTISRIDEILKTGKLSEIKIKKSDKKQSDSVMELMEIHGIGHAKAYELVTKYGITSIKQLIKAYNDGKIDLNNIVLTGLKYHSLYQEQIPRSEVTMIEQYLQTIVKKVDKNLTMTICGSYRRMKPTSNDVDVLLVSSDIKTKNDLFNQGNNNFLIQFIALLKKLGFILDDLTDKDYQIKYMGYCKLSAKNGGNDIIRRIDVRFVPYESYYTSLLYFTGSANFNVKMRRLAEQLGYILNEYGLYKLVGDKKKKVKITSEKDVFDNLGMEYLSPEKRI